LEDITDKACVTSDVKAFPDAFGTIVGEKGVILSGGQKNRLTLARALYKPHAILILDDILSAVDHKTEKQLVDQLVKDKEKVTTVIVSHRVSALTHCDNILILDDGEIVDQGTHSTLISKDGLYQKTWQYQKLEDTNGK